MKRNFSTDEKLEKTIYFLIVLMPISLVSGPFLSDLSATLITFFFLYLSIKYKYYFYYTNFFSKLFLIFYIILIATSILSIDPLISLKKTIPFFRFWILALAIWYIFKKYNNLPKHLLYSFVFIFTILIIDGYIQFFTKENIFGWPMDGARLSSLFKDEYILGSYLSRMLPVFFGMLILTKFDRKKFLYFIFFIIFVGIETLIFLSGERVAFFFINLSSLILIITMKNYKIFRISSIIISIILITLFINIYPKSTERIINKTVDQIGIFSEKKYIFSKEHQNHFISGIRIFKDNKITGAGPRMFRELCGEKKYNLWEGCSTHPHNTYIQLLAETGLIGFTFVVILFFYLSYSILKHLYLKYFFKKNYFSDFQLCLISAILISIWPFTPTGGIFNNWLNIVYFFPVGFFLNTVYSNKKEFEKKF